MAVLRRIEEVQSTRVATSTVVGMVLGVLCLFVLVTAYQFVPRRTRSQPARHTSSALSTSPKPRPLLTRIRTFFNSCAHKRPTTEPAQPGHRTLRSFHLTPERRRERERNRLKFATSLRLKVDIPSFPNFSSRSTPASSPRPPKRAYSRMTGDDDMFERLVRPVDPTVPPPSPYEYIPPTPPPAFKPFASPVTTPCTPPPIYPPPPAYVAGTPLRNGFTSPYNERQTRRQGVIDPFSDPFDECSKAEKGMEINDQLMAEIQQIIEYRERPESGEGPFVVGDSDEDDGDSFSECSI